MTNILIQTNTYFTKERWSKSFDKNLNDEQLKSYTIEYVASTSELLTRLSSADICFTFNLPEFEKIKHLELIYLGISSVNYLDNLNIPKEFNLQTSKGIASTIIAEHTLLMALSLIRKFPNAILNQKRRKWDQSIFIDGNVRSIRDYNIGVLGMGNNGKAIAEIFGNIGCNILGYSNNKGENKYIKKWYLKTDLNQFLIDSEIVIIALPLSNETHHFIDKDKLQMMSKNTMIINISRGEVVNEKEIFIALKNNQIKAAALDVFEKEPLSRWSQLWKLPNLIITPHTAGNVHFLIEEIQNNFISKLRINA